MSGKGDDADDVYRCRACERTFESEEELNRHVRRVGLVE